MREDAPVTDQVRWAAPGRVNLVGEHTDYNDGFVLPFALPQRTTVTARRRDDDVLVLRSGQAADEVRLRPDDLGPGAPTGWAGYAAGVVWALRDAGHPVPGCDLDVDGDVPVGAGLSSSAALSCATALAVADLAGLGLPRTDLAAAARRAENEVVGAPTGVMDQYASLLCTVGHALLLDCRSLEVEQVPLDVDAAGLRLVVVDTRAAHEVADGAYAERAQACREAARQLGVAALRDVEVPGGGSVDEVLAGLDDDVLRRRARHVVTEDARVLEVAALLRDGRLRDVGPLLAASHASLRDDLEVSCRELDVAVDAAEQAGARGARMTGAGFGGSAVALVPEALVDDVRDAVRVAARRAGLVEPECHVVVPSAGAQRVDG